MEHLILPGLNGSGPGHWQRWWLEQVSWARLVEQDCWGRPRVDRWSARVIEAVEASPNSVLVAHSLACALVAHVARLRPDLPVAGALLVAPADVDDWSWTAPEVAAFGPMPQRALPFPSIVVASRNDPFVSFGRARQFAWSWGSSFVDMGDEGHINASIGYGPWPEAIALAERFARSKRRDAGRDRPPASAVRLSALRARDRVVPATRTFPR